MPAYESLMDKSGVNMKARLIETKIVNPLLGSTIDIPNYATNGSAAIDLRACIQNAIEIKQGQRVLIGTGLAINMKDRNLVAIVASRSGLSLKHGVRVAQGIGVIDSDYHGEISVILANDGEQPFLITPGMRIAQLMFQPVIQIELGFTDSFSSETERGTGGFGSTGTS